jgi:hypothetical protein
MTPLAHFQSVWERCDQLKVLHTYLCAHLTVALSPDELLRAEWVARVSALDLYVHELVAQKMLDIFEGIRVPSDAFLRFTIPGEVLMRIRSARHLFDESSAFDLEVRMRLGYSTFQDPEKIAEGIRLISNIELWNEIAVMLGASQVTKASKAKILKRELSLIVERRNKIAHEGDMQPSTPRVVWPIVRADVDHVTSVISDIVVSIDRLV